MAEKKNVLVGLSGGVDSAVSALLLKEQGYDVSAVTLQLWHEDPDSTGKKLDLEIAQKTADQLDIPFTVLDQKAPFFEKVVRYFIESSESGLTPNPCVRCNAAFRWDVFLNLADQMAVQFIATGHYAQIQPENGFSALFKGIDDTKDQSYMLSRLNQAQMRRTILPLGKYKKEEVRKIAHQRGLETAKRSDSQDLCFLSSGDYINLLKRFSPGSLKEGNIVTTSGEVLGTHNGLAAYTIGQRKGIRVAAEKPYYVLAKKIQTNELVIGFAEEMGETELICGDFNWIPAAPLENRFTANVKIRYQAKSREAEIELIDTKTIKIRFTESLRDITPGQIAVLYKEDQVLGGGIIQEK